MIKLMSILVIFFPKKVQLFIHNVRSTSIDKYLNKE